LHRQDHQVRKSEVGNLLPLTLNHRIRTRLIKLQFYGPVTFEYWTGSWDPYGIPYTGLRIRIWIRICSFHKYQLSRCQPKISVFFLSSFAGYLMKVHLHHSSKITNH
jgi:hypothetical protein